MCGQPTASDDDDERDNRAGSTMTKTSCKLNAKVGLVGHHDEKGKENCRLATEVDRICFECKSSLAKSQHLIDVDGQSHLWHAECFKCKVCQQPLDRSTSCHIYRDEVLCREDYNRLQRDRSVKCARCRWPMAATDWVRKAGEHVYHLACFNCDLCQRQLNTGEQFAINVQERAVRLLCRLHFAIEPNQPAGSRSGSGGEAGPALPAKEPATGRHSTPMSPSGALEFPAMSTTTTATATTAPTTANLEQLKQSESKFRLQPQPEAAGSSSSSRHHQQYLQMLAVSCDSSPSRHLDLSSCPSSHGLDEMGGGLNGVSTQAPSRPNASSSTSSTASSAILGPGSLQSKSKRVRTTFTDKQLEILQDQFRRDSNPDGQDLERIATVTGLSKRVTQVWFQNSRARQKKYMIKRKPSSASASPPATSASNAVGLVGATLGQSVRLQTHQQFEMSLHRPDLIGGSGGEQVPEAEFASVRCEGRADKWSNVSDDRSELSHELEDELDDTHSSDGHMIVSEDSD